MSLWRVIPWVSLIEGASKLIGERRPAAPAPGADRVEQLQARLAVAEKELELLAQQQRLLVQSLAIISKRLLIVSIALGAVVVALTVAAIVWLLQSPGH